MDAGTAGPAYIPGHSHCDVMCFELYHNGEPFLVNCGTYAYQCGERRYFRSTQAHNTVQVVGIEQSEIWSTFRLARRSKARVLEVLANGICMELTDYKGNRIRREILLKENSLHIKDCEEGLQLQSHLHAVKETEISGSTHISKSEAMYSPEYGKLRTIQKFTALGIETLELEIALS